MTTNNITVSIASKGDREDCLELLKSRHNEGAFLNVPFSDAKFDKFVTKVLSNKSIGVVAKIDNKVIGITYAVLGEYCLGSRDKVANILVLYVDKELRKQDIGKQVLVKMLSAVKNISEKEGIKYLTTHTSDSIDLKLIDEILRNIGGKTLGGNYLFDLS